MGKEFLCRRNKFGYCRYGEKCRKKHINRLCVKRTCEVFNCEKRHPKICTFKRDYGYCKFAEQCRLNHEKPKEIIAVDEKVLELENRMKNLHDNSAPTCVEAQNDSILKTIENKFALFENMMNNQRKDLEEKNAQILSFELRLDDMEKKFKKEKQTRDKKIKDLENIIKSKPCKEEKVDIFKCSECEFESKSRGGLKTHKARMHTKTKDLKFPTECELCDVILESEKERKNHLRIHTYKAANYKCDECDYVCGNSMTMEVHIGKLHGEIVECGLCNYKAKDLESLNLHISTCETYICEDCCFRTTKLHEIKEHLNSKHDREFFQILHAKVNRKDSEIIDEEYHAKKTLCS